MSEDPRNKRLVDSGLNQRGDDDSQRKLGNEWDHDADKEANPSESEKVTNDQEGFLNSDDSQFKNV